MGVFFLPSLPDHVSRLLTSYVLHFFLEGDSLGHVNTMLSLGITPTRHDLSGASNNNLLTHSLGTREANRFSVITLDCATALHIRNIIVTICIPKALLNTTAQGGAGTPGACEGSPKGTKIHLPSLHQRASRCIIYYLRPHLLSEVHRGLHPGSEQVPDLS